MAASLYINGQFVEGRGESWVVRDPANGQPIETLAGAARSDVDAALASASSGFGLWRALDPWTRSDLVRNVAAVIRSRADQIAAVLTSEQGKPLTQALAEVLTAADQFDWHADEARRLYGRVIESRVRSDRLIVSSEPIGPVAAFSPWNFPALLPARKLAPALAAGCSIVLKPAEETPLTALELARACHDAGVPAGVVNVVMGDPVAISEQLIGSSTIRKVTITGSVPVGRQLMAMAANGPKPISLELGGHAPVIVFDDVDAADAGRQCADAKFRNGGQVCISGTRFIVAESIAEAFTAAFVERTKQLRLGPGASPDTDVGPLTNERRVAAIEHLVLDAVDRGSCVVAGGHRPTGSRFEQGNWFEPTVLAAVPAHAEILRTEPFGPVASISSFASFDEAITLANASDYGLAGYVLTSSLSRAIHASEALEVGMVGVNNFAIATAEAPFGGVKSSGFGREGGSEGIRDYVVTKYVNLRISAPA